MRIRKFKSIANTNSALLEESKKSAKSWTVFWTDNQTEGRGYSGTSWQSEPGKNISLSFLLHTDLNYSELVGFNEWVGCAVCDFVRRFLPDTYVKWPNDIISENKKLCGILIETRKRGKELSIVTGIGLNVNQSDFEGFPKAGSLHILSGQLYDLDELVVELMNELESRYEQVELKQWAEISDQYEDRLYMKDREGQFKTAEHTFRGIIRKVDENGSLVVEMPDGIHRTFIHKEIEMLY